MAFDDIIYLALYILTIIYLTGLGCFSLMRPCEMGNTDTEKKSSKHISNAVGLYMLSFALECFIYLPPILLYGYENSGQFEYNICMMITVCLAVPCTLYVMNALLQQRIRLMSALLCTVFPELLILASYLIYPSVLACYAMIGLSILSYICLFIYFCIHYKRYVQLLKMEFADLEKRDLGWAWYVFGAFTLQGIIYAVHEVWYSVLLEYFYMIFSWLNCSFLVYYSRQVLPIGIPEKELEESQADEMLLIAVDADVDIARDERYAAIENKLKRNCLEAQLFLNAELTRDMLCEALGINRNQLSHYFQAINTTYYNYINELRIQYACGLIEQAKGDLDLQVIARQSGFQNMTTFRNTFRAKYGCLPSAYVKDSDNNFM